MPLSDAQRRAIAAIQAEGEMTFYDYLFHVGDAILRYDTAGALIRGGYLEPDAEANDTEPHDLPLRVVHYRLTGKEQEEDDAATH